MTDGPFKSPQPDLPLPPKRPTRELDVHELSAHVKQQKKRRPWIYTLVGLLTAGGASTGGISIARGESQETKNVRHELAQSAVRKDVDELKLKVDAGQAASDKRIRKVERKVDKLDVKMELLLDAAKVAKSKRPAPEPEDDEP